MDKLEQKAYEENRKLTEEYVVGKITITEYQKRLDEIYEEYKKDLVALLSK